MEQINTRLFNLKNKDNHEYSKIFKEIRLIDESKNIFFESNAILKIRNWESLSEDLNIAFDRALDTFNLLLEYGASKSKIFNECIFLTHEITKVRNSTQLKNSIQYGFNKIHPRDQINGNRDISRKKPKKVEKRVVSSTDFNNPKLSPQDRRKLTTECYNILFNEVNNIIEIDRLINNYKNISTRFNIDKIFTESTLGKRDLYDAIYTIAYCVSSYNAPFKNIYNSALETAWYGINKKNINTTNSSIIEAVTDFFIFSEGISEENKNDIIAIKEISPIFSKDDFSCINFLYKKPNKKFITIENVIDDISGLDEYMPTEKDKENFKLIINDFKKSYNDSIAVSNIVPSTNIARLKAIAEKISTTYKDSLFEYFSSIMQIIRLNYIIYNPNDNSKEVISIIKQMLRPLLRKNNYTKTQYKYITDIIEKEISYIKNKLEKLKQQDEFSDSIYNSYMKGLLSIQDSLLARMNLEEIENDTEEESEITEAKQILCVSNLLESITKKLENNDINNIVCGNLNNFSYDVLNSIVEFAIVAPNILSKEKIKYALELYRDNLRKNENIENFIKIDFINECILKLSTAKTYDIYQEIDTSILYLMCINELQYITANNNKLKYFTEQSSLSSILKFASNKLRNKIINENNTYIKDIIEYIDNKDLSIEDKENLLQNSVLKALRSIIQKAILIHKRWIVNIAILIINIYGKYFSRNTRSGKEQEYALLEIINCIDMIKNQALALADGEYIIFSKKLINALHINYTKIVYNAYKQHSEYFNDKDYDRREVK